MNSREKTKWTGCDKVKWEEYVGTNKKNEGNKKIKENQQFQIIKKIIINQKKSVNRGKERKRK